VGAIDPTGGAGSTSSIWGGGGGAAAVLPTERGGSMLPEPTQPASIRPAARDTAQARRFEPITNRAISQAPMEAAIDNRGDHGWQK
jgi:hypothetical protein